jgi:ribose transport system permease protein
MQPAEQRLRTNWLRQGGLAIGCAALFVIFSALNANFYQPANLLDIMLQSSINAVIAVGMTLVVMTKGIDLSVGSIAGVSSMIAANLQSGNLALGIAAGLLVGLSCGLVNGLLIAKMKLPDFIVTLGTMSIYRGAALIYTNGQPIYSIDETFRSIFAGQLLGIPTPVLLALGIAVLAYLLVRFTSLGEHIIAVGGNEEAARLSGVDVDKVKISVYAISGVLASIAGFVLVARIGAAEPIGGTGFELQAIGAAVIGGASLFGGEGNPLGSLIGALTLGAMQNGLTLMNVPSFWQYVATGVVVILAVLADQVARKSR